MELISAPPLCAPTKYCPSCERRLAAENFGRARQRRDGLRAYCRACEQAEYRQRHAADPERFRDLAKDRQKRYRERHGDQLRKTQRQRQAEEGAQAVARRKVRQAIDSGRLTRPDACPECGNSRRAIQAHHADYSRPLDIEWLCAPCHKELHIHGG